MTRKRRDLFKPDFLVTVRKKPQEKQTVGIVIVHKFRSRFHK